MYFKGVNMLRAKAEIVFTLDGKNYKARDDFRVPFNFGEGLIFSGNIIGQSEDNYICNNKYLVNIDFFTIEDEAYEAVAPLLKTNMTIPMQAGRQLLGKAKLLEFSYSKQ